MNRREPGERAASGGPRPQTLLALFAAGLAAFNFPLLLVWDIDAPLFGLPALPVFLFAIWVLLILALAYASERSARAIEDIDDILPPAGPGGPP